MEFSPGYSNPLETPRPSVFSQPMGDVTGDAIVPWLHTPPTHMPWGINQPSLVHFTGGPTSGHVNDGFCHSPHYAHVKRKIDPEIEIMPSPKLHITEEKMAAHMSQLRISPEVSTPPTLEPMSNDSSKVDSSDPGKIRKKQEIRRLIVCDEIRRLKSDLNVLPSALFSRLEKPSMALVLWQPPVGSLGQHLEDAVEFTRRTEEESQTSIMVDNNNSTFLDLNTLAIPSRYNQPSTSMPDPDPDAMDL